MEMNWKLIIKSNLSSVTFQNNMQRKIISNILHNVTTNSSQELKRNLQNCPAFKISIEILTIPPKINNNFK